MRGLRREPCREMSAGGMTGHHHARQIERIAARDLVQRVKCCGDVLERSRITAARIPDAPELDIPRREAVAR